MSDAAAVAGVLWDRWLPPSVQTTIANGLDPADARRLTTWLAAVHDLGKATPAFACQVDGLFGRMQAQGLNASGPLVDRRAAPHATASHVLLRRWLRTAGMNGGVADTYAVVVGGHHGVPPASGDLWAADSRRLLGDGPWLTVQTELAEFATDLTDVHDLLGRLSDRPLDVRSQVLLTGVVIVSDWLASDSERFPYDDPSGSPERADRAWQSTGLTAPWRPRQHENLDVLFSERFTLPQGATLRPVQRVAMEVARDVDAPGLVIVEAPMGEGKTEAALAAAEVLAERAGAGGCFVALPTMATTDAMFSRVLDWVRTLPDEPRASVFLAHGKSGLNEEFRELVFDGRIRGVAQDDIAGSDALDGSPAGVPETVAVALEWLSGRKKGVLSNFVVGTIDQILVGALKSRHLVLRHLALASKVVIIDEVHAADSYMSEYLDRVLAWLGAYGVPTVLLSATLPSSRRVEMISAYESARAVRSPVARPLTRRRRDTGSPGVDPYAALRGDIGYPVITASTGGSPVVRVADASGRGSRVLVERVSDDDATLLEILDGAGSQGGSIAVVRNTVARAQSTAALLKGVYGSEVVLLHSRFLAADRAQRELQLRAELGPPGPKVRRPQRRIVVGTQVLEQSLDVDFDLLITDLAPTDLLLQRIGRLHRHPRAPGDRPPALEEPRCVITGVEDWNAMPPAVIEASEHVYGRAPLLRTLAVLGGHLDSSSVLDLPGDIAPLVQSTYAEHVACPTAWGSALEVAQADHDRDLLRRRKQADQFRLGPVPALGVSLLGWLARGVGDADDGVRGQAAVRDSDDSLEVMVAQRVGGDLRILPWIAPYGGAVLSQLAPPDAHLARALATCTVRLPSWMSKPWLEARVIGALERDGIAAWQRSPWLRGQLMLVLDDNLTAEVGEVRVTYSCEEGLLARRLEGGSR